METKTELKKEVRHAFGKDVYFIGKDKDGLKHWLEAPRWDCGWYWGFGYIEVYKQNWHPSKARDINSHSHWSGLVGQQEDYNFEKSCFVKGKYFNHINEALSTPLTDKESWELSDLMKSFYTLTEMAEFYKNGNSHLTSTAISKEMVDTKKVKEINEVTLPKIFKRVIKIVSP